MPCAGISNSRVGISFPCRAAGSRTANPFLLDDADKVFCKTVYWLAALSNGTSEMQLDLRHVVFEGKRGPDLAGSRGKMPFETPATGPRRCSSCRSGPRFSSLGHWSGGVGHQRYRRQPLLRRVPACLRTLKVRSVEEARELLETRPELLPAAISSLLIGVTEFFREPAVFESVRTEVLPRLVGKRRPLRAWSGACSTGEELYSLAILLAEAGLLRRSFLLGTDCRPDAIEHARAARYGSAAVRSLEPAIRGKYFEPADRFWRPIQSLRRRVRWKAADLAQRIEKGPWDLILWRNAAIYLNPKRPQRLDPPGRGVKPRRDLDRWQRRTAPGGLEIAPRGTLRLSQERALTKADEGIPMSNGTTIAAGRPKVGQLGRSVRFRRGHCGRGRRAALAAG